MNFRYLLLLNAIFMFVSLSGYAENKTDKNPIHLNSKLMTALNNKYSLEEIQKLTERGADINAVGENGWSPLLYAVLYDNDPEIVEFLLDRGADVNFISRDGRNPLLGAAGYSHNRKVFKLLIDAGADPNRRTAIGHSPLMEAVKKQDDPLIIKMLINAGCNINVSDSIGQTVFMMAAQYQDNPDIISLLLEEGADIHAKTTGGQDKGSTALMYASRYQDTSEIIENLLKSGADVNNQNSAGWTSLMLAARFQKNTDIINLLISYGADIDKSNDNGDNALLIASWYRQDIALFKMLIDAGADLEIKNASGDNALITAVKKADMYDKDLSVVLFLLKSGADLNSENHKGESAWGLIKYKHKWRDSEAHKYMEICFIQENIQSDIITALNNNSGADKVIALLQKGGWMEISFYDGWTPLITAAIREVHVSGVKLLIELGGDVLTSVADWKIIMNVVSQNENSVESAVSSVIREAFRLKKLSTDFIHALKENSSYDTILRFIEDGVSVNLPDENNISPLGYAASSGESEICKLLIENGAEIKKHYLIDAAANNKNLDIFPLLFEFIDVDTRDEEGKTPLMHAIKNQTDPEIVTIFIKAGQSIDAGADVNASDQFGFTSLMHALCWQQKPEFIRLLLDAGANVNAQDQNGSSPLMLAVSCQRDIDIIELLLNAGADINTRSFSGVTALYLAAGSNTSNELLELLIDAGADLNLTDDNGISPLMNAAINSEDQEIMRILINSGADVNLYDITGMSAWDYIQYNKTLKGTEIYNLLGELSYIIEQENVSTENFFKALKDDSLFMTVKSYIDSNGDVNIEGPGGWSPLMIAADFLNNALVFQWLLDAGADVKHEDPFCRTALLVASGFCNNPEVIKLLIDAGADLDNQNYMDETTPLIEAVVRQKTDDIPLLLLDAGADPSIKDVDGMTAWDHIQENEFLLDTELFHRLKKLSN